MSDSITEIRRRLQLATELPEMLDTSNRAATHWRDDTSSLLAEIERLQAEVTLLAENGRHILGRAERAEQEIARLRAVAHAANGAFLAFAKAPPELADDHELMRAMSTLGAALDSYDTLRESKLDTKAKYV